jgi:WD40 repeat protein
VLAEHASVITPTVTVEQFAAMCASLERHVAVIDVQASGAVVLSWLCQDDSNAATFMDQEALAHMLAAMHAHPSSETVQLCGFKLLHQLSLRPPYKSGLLRSRRVHGVTARAITEHAENDEIQRLIDTTFGMCMGVHLESITVPVGVCNGIAFSSDGAYMAVSDHYDGSVALFSMPKAIFLRRFGSKGSGPDQCNWVFRLCFVPASHNVLVCDKGNNRIQEYDVTGVHVRSIPVQWPKAVACDGKVIIVGNDAFGGDNIAVFDYATGSPMKTFGMGAADAKQRYCSGLCLSKDSSTLAVAETRGKLSLIDREGALLFRKGDSILADGALDVAFGSNNSELVLCDPVQKRVVLFSHDGEECLNVWTSDWLAAPTALAVSNGRLYVVSNDGTDSTVEVFR